MTVGDECGTIVVLVGVVDVPANPGGCQVCWGDRRAPVRHRARSRLGRETASLYQDEAVGPRAIEEGDPLTLYPLLPGSPMLSEKIEDQLLDAAVFEQGVAVRQLPSIEHD